MPPKTGLCPHASILAVRARDYVIPDGRGNWLPFALRREPGEDAALDDLVLIDVELPPGSGHGPVIDRRELARLGVVSAPRFRAYIAAHSVAWRPEGGRGGGAGRLGSLGVADRRSLCQKHVPPAVGGRRLAAATVPDDGADQGRQAIVTNSPADGETRPGLTAVQTAGRPPGCGHCALPREARDLPAAPGGLQGRRERLLEPFRRGRRSPIRRPRTSQDVPDRVSGAVSGLSPGCESAAGGGTALQGGERPEAGGGRDRGRLGMRRRSGGSWWVPSMVGKIGRALVDEDLAARVGRPGCWDPEHV